MAAIFNKVVRRPADGGMVYRGRKHAALKKVKCFDAEFAFRDRGRLLHAYSRPGIFSTGESMRGPDS